MQRIARYACLTALVLWTAAAPAWAKDKLVFGLPIEPTGLDPTIAAPVAIREVTWGNVFEGLTTLDEKGNVLPLLAKSWTVSPDGMTYTFQLQPGVTFHNGVAFDSGTVKFTLDRARSPRSTNAQKQLFEPIESVETPDPLTAVVKLKRPVAAFLYDMAWGDASMVEPSTVDTNRTQPNGTGPFKLAAWARGDRVELERNPAYWDHAYPKVDHVTFRFIGDPQAQAAALRAGDIDGFADFQAPELLGDFKRDPKFRISVGVTPGKVVAGFNNGRKPFDDPRVRQALMAAVNRQTVIEGAFGGLGTPIGSHYAPTDAGYIDTTGVIPFDPAKAKAMLAEAGVGNGLTVTMKVPQMAYATHAAEVLQALFADVGVTLNIVPSEFPAQWIEDVFKKRDFDLTIIDHAEPNDIGIYARPDYYFDYHNPALNAVIAAAQVESDTTKRDALLGKAQMILAQQVPALYLFDVPRLGVFDTHVTGIWVEEPISNMLVKNAAWKD
jgi:peptide/nickel transport system substrate-binding protein